MAESNAFSVDCERNTLIVSPLRNISSLAEEETKSQWEEIVRRIDDGEAKHVVFDFASIKYFGSSMLEAMLVLWKRIQPNDGKLAVCNVSDTANEILRLSKFDTIWPVLASREEALDEVNS